MSSGPTIQGMSLGLYSLMLAFAKLAPSPDLFVNSCISLPEPLLYIFTLLLSHSSLVKKKDGERKKYLSASFILCPLGFRKNATKHWLVWNNHSVTTNPGLASGS